MAREEPAGSRVLVIAHSEYALARAWQLFSSMAGARIVGPARGRRGALRAAIALLRQRPPAVYLIDVGVSTTVCALLARSRRARVILDTGDLAFALARSVGGRSRIGLASVWLGERLTLRCAGHVVVRGRAHAAFLPYRPTTYAPDLAPPQARPVDGSALRAELGLGGRFVVGLVGSLNLAPRLGTCYGWDLVEALAHTPASVAALIVGDGDGRTVLEGRARELGVADRCRFVGRVPTERVAEWIAAMDAAVSTQTNDAVGAVRTTGKLPLYLACGCPVLASDVGEARRLLGPLGWTIPYKGVVDPEYPKRLAGALLSWASEPSAADERRARALELAATAFDAGVVTARVQALLGVARA